MTPHEILTNARALIEIVAFDKAIALAKEEHSR